MNKTDEKKKKQKLSRIFANNWYMVKRIAKYSPLYIFCMVIEGVIWGVINSVEVVYTKQLFDSIDLQTPFWSFGGPAFWMVLMASFYIVVRLLDKLYALWWLPFLKNKIFQCIQAEVFEKAAKTDLANYDDPTYYNDFVWAMNEADKRAFNIVNDIGKLINRAVALTLMLSVLLTIDLPVTLAIFIGAVITTVIWLNGNKVNLAYSMESKPISKTSNYIFRVFHLPDYAKELRTSKASELVKRRFYENNEKNLQIALKYGKKYFTLYGLFDNIIRNLVYFGVLVYMTFRLLGYIGSTLLLGGFAASVNVCWRFRWMFADLCERITKFPEHSLYVEKYRDFMEHEDRIKSGTVKPERFETLKIDNVDFSYEAVKPDKDGNIKRTEVLKKVSIEIKRGDKIAFVGYNGAGKTTLIKLIMRLYDVSGGAIYYNGTDLRELDLEEYRSHIGAVFQDFKLFAATVAENVVGGGYDESMKDDVIKALDAATFSEKLTELKDGIDTPLTREYNDKGTNLSGGEAQKVAIARVFAKPYELIIMDEPSAALDPMAEALLNKAILEYAREHTIIFISHRLSTTKIADKIYMFDDGSLIEEGSHDELMEADGKYAEMFSLQAEKYRAEQAG